MRTESHLHSTDELADGRHHVIPCPVPGHEGERDSPGLDVRYSPEAAGRRPIGRQWLLRCWGDRCPYGSIVQALGIAPESASVGENANHMVAAYDHVDGLSRRVYHAWWPDDFPDSPDVCPWRDCGRSGNDRHRHTSVRGSQAGARVSIWGPPAADSVLVVVGSEDEAVALLQAGARWAGFIPVTWYRAGREPELDRDSAGSSDWSPVRDRQVAFWPRERGDSLDEMLRAAHMALDAGAIGMWTIRADPVEELPWPDVLDTLRSTIQAPGPPPKTGVELPPELDAVLSPGPLNSSDSAMTQRFLRDHGDHIVGASHRSTEPGHVPPVSVYVRTESGPLRRDDDLLGKLMWKTAQGYREELEEFIREGALSDADVEVCTTFLWRMESRDGLRALFNELGTAHRVMLGYGAVPPGYRHVRTSDLDADTRLLGAPNCVIDLETGVALSGRDAGDTLVTLAITDPYDAEARHPDVDALAEHLAEKDLGELLQAMAFGLRGEPRDHTLFVTGPKSGCGTALVEAASAALGADYAAEVAADVLFRSGVHPSFMPTSWRSTAPRIWTCTNVNRFRQPSAIGEPQLQPSLSQLGVLHGRPPAFVAMDQRVLTMALQRADLPIARCHVLGHAEPCEFGRQARTRLSSDPRARQALVALLVRECVAQTEQPIELEDTFPPASMWPVPEPAPQTRSQAEGPMQQLDRWLGEAMTVTGHPGDRVSSAALWQAARLEPTSGSDPDRVWGMSRRSFTTRAIQVHELDSPSSVRIDGTVTTGWTGVRMEIGTPPPTTDA